MSKVLAIDFGLKRCGLALSDDSKTFAFPLETVESNLLESKIQQLVVQENIDTLVLGMPKRMNNEDSHVSENVRLLHTRLVELFPMLKTVLEDERYTSKLASQAMHLGGASKKQMRDKTLVDKVSASLILQSYLESL